MIYHSKSPTPNNQLLVPVPSELLDSRGSDITTIEIEGKKYNVFDYYYYEKDCGFPKVMMYLATGKIINPNAIWGKYTKSDGIYFFVCSEVKGKEENNELPPKL